jgi:HNH endonuclease
MIEVLLTKGQTAIIDDKDSWVLDFKWYAKWDKKLQGYYAAREVSNKTVLMSRAIMNAPKGLIVDHINHDTLDNRRENLRIVTYGTNNRNRRAYGKSRYIGVSWNKSKNKWQSSIVFDRKCYGLGAYFNEIEAARAFDKKKFELTNSIIGLNFPEDYT